MSDKFIISYEILQTFKNTISIERLQSFYEHNDVKDIDALIDCYVNNIKLSQSFYPILSILEISLRNALDTMLKTYVSPNWIQEELREQNLLCDYDFQTLKKAYNDTKKTYKDNFSYGKVIAGLHFGFWTSLCSKKYNVKLWTQKGRFQSVFVNYPKNEQQKIHQISLHLDLIRRFRNRIFHYEPILKNGIKMLELHDKIVKIIGYLPTDSSKLLERTDNFYDVYEKIRKQKT